MSDATFANEDLMDDYMADLLTEEVIGEDIQRQTVARLLHSAQDTSAMSLMDLFSATNPLSTLAMINRAGFAVLFGGEVPLM